MVALPDASTIEAIGSEAWLEVRLSRRYHLTDPDLLDMIQALLTRLWSLAILAATTGNLIIQAGLLAVSLSALAYDKNVIAPWVAIVLAVGGILLLAWSTTSVIRFRKQESLGSGAEPAVDAPDDADDSPDHKA